LEIISLHYPIDADGNNLQFLVQNTYGRFRPSPDGNHIALTLHRSGTLVEGEYDLYLMEIDQGNLIQLTQTGNSHSQIWSPSGDYITFVLEEESQNTIISAPIEEPSSLKPLISSTDLLGPYASFARLGKPTL
jgi:Tol biopolymer transport system component